MIRATAPHLQDARDEYQASGAWPDEVVDPVSVAAAADPGRMAIVDRSERFTYQALDRAINEIAAGLADRGLNALDTVLLVTSNDCRCVIAFHALRRLGVVCALISEHAGPAELSHALARTEPRLAMVPNRLTGLLSDRHPFLAWMGYGDPTTHRSASTLPLDQSDPNVPAVLVFTSGSTSRPKGVIHSTNTLRVAAANYIGAAGLERSDRFFVISPLSSITGVLQALVMAPMLHGCVVLEEAWDEEATFDLLVSQQSTFYGGPDVVLRRLMDEADRRGQSSLPLRAVSVGGTLLDADLLRRAEKHFGICVMRAYGSSEAPFSTATLRTALLEDRLELDGQPIGEVGLRIGSQRDEGECLIRGPHLFLGYLDAEDNEEAFEDDWFRTGDTGVLRGDQLKVIGRLKEIVIRNGFKISMTAVESAARALPFLEDAAAFGRPDQDTGEHLVLALRPIPGVLVELEMLTAALLQAGLAKRSLPEELVIWDVPFPRTVTDKLNRAALAADSVNRPQCLADRLRP